MLAEGMAIAFFPIDSIAQQSEHPSVIHSSSPSRNILSTCRLYTWQLAPRGNRNRGFSSLPKYLDCTLISRPSNPKYGINSDGAS
jgi:hypothetical protein